MKLMKCFGDEQADNRADSDGDQRIDEPLAQLDQVLEKRHAAAGFLLGELRGVLRLGDCLPSLACLGF